MIDADSVDYILACLGEECGEVQQLVGKSQRFGLTAKYPVTPETPTNLDNIHKEVTDIIAVYKMLCDELGVSSAISDVAIQKKIDRVNYYKTVDFRE